MYSKHSVHTHTVLKRGLIKNNKVYHGGIGPMGSEQNICLSYQRCNRHVNTNPKWHKWEILRSEHAHIRRAILRRYWINYIILLVLCQTDTAVSFALFWGILIQILMTHFTEQAENRKEVKAKVLEAVKDCPTDHYPLRWTFSGSCLLKDYKMTEIRCTTLWTLAMCFIYRKF